MPATEPWVIHQTANTYKIYFDGKDIGTISSFSDSTDLGVQPIYAIGTNIARELQPTTFSASFTASGVLVKTKSAIAAGLIGQNGAAELAKTLAGQYFDIAVISQGTPMRQFLDCRITSYSEQVNAGAAVSFNMSGLARDTNGTSSLGSPVRLPWRWRG